MKNKFFTHKFLPILLIFLFVLFIFFVTNVKATNISCNGLSFTIPDTVPDLNYVVFTNGGKTHIVLGSFDFFTMYIAEGKYYIGNVKDGVWNRLYYYDIPIGQTNFPNMWGPGDTGYILCNTTNKDDINILCSSVDVCDTSGNVFYIGANHIINYSIELSNNFKTNAPIIAYSNYFDYSDAKKYECYISLDASNWTLMNYETFNDTVNNITKFRFNYKIYHNGCYYFKFLNIETNEEYYLSYNITNIIKNSSNSGFTSNSIPQPFCTYERVNNEFLIKTQSFNAEDMQKYRCFYTTSPGIDYSSWNEMSMGSFNNALTGEIEYYFFFTVPADSEDCIFYFVFYDNNLKEYGSPSSMNCSFDKMNEYADSLSPTISEKNNRFYDLLNYFKERFGFLTYPFEFLIDFFNRLLNINYSEPIIHIPELKEPFGNNKIFNGIDFNFNSLLNNSTFSYLYNIYLIAVDFVIVILFIFLCKKVIEEVFTNG